MNELEARPSAPHPAKWLPLVAVGLSALAAYWWVRHKSQLATEDELAWPIDPVSDFDVTRFLGDWYEIARIERGLGKPLTRSRVEYLQEPDGSLRIIYRGFHTGTHRWVETPGCARFLGAPHFGAMKASFFGPFFEGYHVVAIDPDYHWAMIMGDTAESFRLISRSPVLNGETADRLVRQAERLGVHPDRIHWVMQDGVNPTGQW